MILIELQGGLGNQMFQYACGKAFALKQNQQLLIDNTFLSQNQVETGEFTPRTYALDVFNLNTEIAGKQLIKSFDDNSVYNKTLKLLGLPHKRCYCEMSGKGAGQLNSVTPPVLLKGYWQSEQYFAGYEEQVREAFTFKIDSISGLNPVIEQISCTNSVSIHFRRGDYLTNPVAQKVLGALDMDYYKAAIKKIQAKITDPFFYIFSDDIEWVKSNLPVIENYRIIEGFGDNTHYDMLLMSKCKHHIVANSSFSWWGAWLNAYPRKIVIAPKRWFADEQHNANSTYLIPKEWIRV